MDALIAERVMEWQQCGSDYSRPEHRPSKDYPGSQIDDWESKGPHRGLESPDGRVRVYFCGCEDSGGALPDFSTDIAAAILVIEKVIEGRSRDHVVLEHIPGGKLSCWRCRFCVPDAFAYAKNYVEAVAETLPEAICLAALKAVGVPT